MAPGGQAVRGRCGSGSGGWVLGGAGRGADDAEGEDAGDAAEAAGDTPAGTVDVMFIAP
jgi:hypothetical protein